MTKSLIPALLWLVFITGLSVLPSVPLPKFDLFSPDKLGHAAAYGLLVWLILWGWHKAKRTITRSTAAWVALFATGYGVLMEFVQGAFIPGRFYEYDDMIANAIGALVVLGYWLLVVGSRAPNSQQ